MDISPTLYRGHEDGRPCLSCEVLGRPMHEVSALPRPRLAAYAQQLGIRHRFRRRASLARAVWREVNVEMNPGIDE